MLPKRFPPPGPPSRPRGTRVGRGMAAPSPAAEREPAGQQDRRRGARPVRAGRCAPPPRRQVRAGQVRAPSVQAGTPPARCVPPPSRQVRRAPSVQAGARRPGVRPLRAGRCGARQVCAPSQQAGARPVGAGRCAPAPHASAPSTTSGCDGAALAARCQAAVVA